MTTTAFSPRGKYQNRGSGIWSLVHLLDQIREQALLLVCLRDLDLVQVDPVGLTSPACPKNRSSDRMIGGLTLASRSSPAHAGLPWRV